MNRDKKHPVRVLFILHDSNMFGGVARVTLSLVKTLYPEWMEPVFVMAAGGPLVDELDALGIENTVLSAPLYGSGSAGAQRYFNDFFERVSRVKQIIADFRIEIVHTHTNLLFEGAVAALEMGVPHVFHMHTILPETRKAVGLNWLAMPDELIPSLYGILSSRIIAVSEVVAQHFAQVRDKVDVVYNGIDFETFDELVSAADTNLRSSLQVEPNATLVTLIGRITKSKNIELFIRAAAIVLRRSPDCHFLIIGPDSSPDYTSSLVAQAREAGLSERVHFLGSRQDVPTHLKQSDLCVISSHNEGFPTVCLEAMAAGIPVVATRCGGTMEQIEDAATGYLVDEGDESALAERVIALADDRVLREKMGGLGRQRAEKFFSSRRCAEHTLDVYERAISNSLDISNHPQAISACAYISILRSHMVTMERLQKVERGFADFGDLRKKLEDLAIYRGAKRLYKAVSR